MGGRRGRRRATWCSLVAGLVALVAPSAPRARADELPRGPSLEKLPAEGESPTRPYLTVLATSYVGDGLRFNDPYRLATPLGGDAQSVSRTAAYVDVGGGILLFAPPSLQHGLALRMSIAVEGIHQSVLTPAYMILRRFRAFALYGRVGVPIVLSPQKNNGFELSVGGAWFVRGGLGLTAEIVGDLFYGAGTREVARPAYPLLSGQLGLIVAYEVLP